MKRIKSVDEYILNHEKWQQGLIMLREIMLAKGLEETIKWSAPVYMLKGENVAGLGAFKNHLAVWFYQGALLKDAHHMLINAQVGTTKALRQWRFTASEQISQHAEIISAYIDEAMQNAREGKKVKPARNKPVVIPPELQKHLDASKELNLAFAQLSNACKREYCDYIAGAKKPETKERRIDKVIPMILEKKGLNDRYK